MLGSFVCRASVVRWTQQHDKYQPTHWPCLLFRDAHNQHGEHRITKLMSVRSTQYWCQRPLLGLKRCSESMATTQQTSTTDSSLCWARCFAGSVLIANDSGHPRDVPTSAGEALKSALPPPDSGRRNNGRHDDISLDGNQLTDDLGEALEPSFTTPFHDQVLAFDVTGERRPCRNALAARLIGLAPISSETGAVDATNATRCIFTAGQCSLQRAAHRPSPVAFERCATPLRGRLGLLGAG